ncbi:hypothetical protein PUN28_008954 [Cardiocondyla obscurior]|uniref:Uncharacterized protein n=1 Tax=Cardiocondyla obscurior TaxID=286306 RepID=A0AAW2FUT1_9HYME
MCDRSAMILRSVSGKREGRERERCDEEAARTRRGIRKKAKRIARSIYYLTRLEMDRRKKKKEKEKKNEVGSHEPLCGKGRTDVNVCRYRVKTERALACAGCEARKSRVENTYIRHSAAGRSKSSNCPRVADQASVQKPAVDDVVVATFKKKEQKKKKGKKGERERARERDADRQPKETEKHKRKMRRTFIPAPEVLRRNRLRLLFSQARHSRRAERNYIVKDNERRFNNLTRDNAGSKGLSSLTVDYLTRRKHRLSKTSDLQFRRSHFSLLTLGSRRMKTDSGTRAREKASFTAH